MPMPGRGRVAKWTREQINELSTLELRALLENAERLKETEVAALCNELLDARPRGRPPARRNPRNGGARGLVTRGKAFEMNGVSLANRVWSRGGVRADGTVVFALRADEVQQNGSESATLLWSPAAAPTPGTEERLEHCRAALERGAAEGLLIYGKRAAGAAPAEQKSKADRVDAETVLKLRVEKRGEEYWATWTAQNRVVTTYE